MSRAPAWPPLPKTVPGLAGPIKVTRPRRIRSSDEFTVWGDWSFTKRRIRVVATLSRERAWHVLLHELTHAIDDDAGLNLGKHHTEAVADAIGSGMLNLLRSLVVE